MSKNSKKLSNPFSTGGGGGHFEAHVQALFVVLMLTGGCTPCLSGWSITEIKLQGKVDGFDTDDLIIFAEKNDTKEKRKLLGQVKHSISITQADSVFSEVIQAAWNDFNNPSVFTKGKDIIALMTGPLSAADNRSVQWLLNYSKHTKNADEFYQNVNQAYFSSAKSREKLDVIQHHLKLANNGLDVSKEDSYWFLRHFHLLGYDLGTEFGVVLSLLHSHISQFNQDSPQFVWSRIVDIVQTWNQDGGTIVLDNLPEDLRETFKKPGVVYIPKELTAPQIELVKTDWNQHQYATDLALASLIGAWNEQNTSDTSVVTKLTAQDYSVWVAKIREILLLPDSPLSLHNSSWNILERQNLWDLLGRRIFDQNLDTFREIAVAVLTERNPSFEMSPEERYAAIIYGKVFAYSSDLRMGLAEGLALLGTRPNVLVHCSQSKAEGTAILAIREIFVGADWTLWGSLNNLLPVLAEAAPEEFLNVVDNALSLSPCPFDELFSQERGGLAGSNYLTGLLWALESLAWDEEYLVRICVILGELSSHDPGGTWANRPADSLTTILLPWLPQTTASIEKRKVAVQTLLKELPEVGWRLIISLLPKKHQSSTGSHKPSWRNTIPENWEARATPDEYWAQVCCYAELAVSTASRDINKLVELVEHFDHLPRTSFDQLLEVLSSDAISLLPEEERLNLWDKLTKFTSKHRRFSDAEWALSDELLSPIEAVAEKLAPSSPLLRYQPLFADASFDLYEENGNWEEQDRRLNERRQRAIREVLELGGVSSIVQFAGEVESPVQVGHHLGSLADSEIDRALLPQFLETGDRKLSLFISSYIWSRYCANNWNWADHLDKSSWSSGQISQFLSYLPFTQGTWNRVEEWLGDLQSYYWINTNVNPYQSEGALDIAIDKLIEYGKPYAAINCLNKMRYDRQPINMRQCARALLAARSSSEPSNYVDAYHLAELIKMLQESPEVDPDDLFQVEWSYLTLLDGHYGVTPKLLEKYLANDPEFFCEIIRAIYRSTKTNVTTSDPSKQAIATNAWRLLEMWHIPPGLQEDGSFNDDYFSAWLQRVKENSTESGHLKVALLHVGKVLIYCPPDQEGLWINHTVASSLNAKDAEEVRSGFRTGVFNSRGVHWVDPTGQPERELAEQYRQKAEDAENAGYQRFAAMLRGISESYEREAQQIVAENEREFESNE